MGETEDTSICVFMFTAFLLYPMQEIEQPQEEEEEVMKEDLEVFSFTNQVILCFTGETINGVRGERKTIWYEEVIREFNCLFSLKFFVFSRYIL